MMDWTESRQDSWSSSHFIKFCCSNISGCTGYSKLMRVPQHFKDLHLGQIFLEHTDGINVWQWLLCGFTYEAGRWQFDSSLLDWPYCQLIKTCLKIVFGTGPGKGKPLKQCKCSSEFISTAEITAFTWFGLSRSDLMFSG